MLRCRSIIFGVAAVSANSGGPLVTVGVRADELSGWIAGGPGWTCIILRRDNAGRLLSEEQHPGEKPPFQDIVDQAPPEQREQMAAHLKQVLGETISSGHGTSLSCGSAFSFLGGGRGTLDERFGDLD